MQNGKTADSWMREEHFANLAQAKAFGRPGSASAKYSLSRRAGEVGVKWNGLGSTFLTFPPRRDALHGKQADLAFVDEAWAHNAETGADLRQAIRPTMATRRGAQLWIVSTLGDDSSTFLDDYVSMARQALGDPASRICLVDYGIGDDVDPEDLDAVAAAHPAYGHTVDRQALLDARAEFGDDIAGWARAYGNRATRTRETAIPAVVWAAAGRPRPDVPARAGLGLDATPSGSHFAVSSGWRATTASEAHRIAVGDGLVEVLEQGPTSRETPALLAALARRNDAPLVVDRAAIGALELLDAVARDYPDVAVEYLNMGQYASACGTFYRGVMDDTVHHFNDPDLDDDVANAVKRQLGDGGFGWGRKDSNGNVHRLVSATVALKAFDMLPAPRRRAVARAGRR
jgi:hypothetical protein